MVKTDKSQKILSELEQFIGTTRYYTSTFGGLLLTEGIQYLRERLNCYWLVDVVESYQPMPRNETFQVWSIDVRQDRSAVVEMKQDTGLEPLVSQEIGYTDFKLSRYELFCIDGIVLLKSEY